MLLKWLDTKIGRDDYNRARMVSRENLEKYGVFDVNGGIGMKTQICNDRSPCCGLVRLYASMGLHRYNLLQGTKLQLSHVKKYNRTLGAAASAYFITLVAMDPSSSKPLVFQTDVSELSCGKFVLTSYTARPRVGTITNDGALKREFYRMGSLPECPQENPFANRNRFYMVEESELQVNDWIRLYLELAVAISDRTTQDHDLSNLNIVQVAIESMKDVEPPNVSYLNSKNAIVYIRYTDLCEARVGKAVDRIAIVERTFNERTGCFSLKGQNQSSEIIPETIPEKGMSRSTKLPFRRLSSSSLNKPWRRNSPRTHRIVLSRRARKTRSTESESTNKGDESECETSV